MFYFGLSYGYSLYLNAYECQKCTESDPFTTHVSKLTTQGLNLIGLSSEEKQSIDEPKRSIFIEGKLTSYVNEGCNALSVMIIFLAFVWGFYSGFLKTLLFSGFGFLFLHGINILRIIGLNYIFHLFPEYGKIGHDYIFPAIIYGSIVILWIFWVLKFALPFWKKHLFDETKREVA